MPETDTVVKFIGWQRLPGQKWQKVAEASSHAEAMTKTLDTRFPGNRRDVVVLPAGTDPNRSFRL